MGPAPLKRTGSQRNGRTNGHDPWGEGRRLQWKSGLYKWSCSRRPICTKATYISRLPLLPIGTIRQDGGIHENPAIPMIPGAPTLSRIAAVALLAFHSLAAYEWGGWVMDDVGRPLAGPRICWLSDTSRCVLGDESGEFRIALPLGPAAIGRPVSAAGLRVEFARGTIMLHAPRASIVALDWFTPRGRRLRHSVLTMKPDGVDVLQGSNWPEASGGLVLLRVSGANTSLIVKVMLLGSRPRLLPQAPLLSQSPDATPLAKAASVLEAIS